MKPAEIDKDSWHYKFIMMGHESWNNPDNTCQYVVRFLWMVLVTLVFSVATYVIIICPLMAAVHAMMTLSLKGFSLPGRENLGLSLELGYVLLKGYSAIVLAVGCLFLTACLIKILIYIVAEIKQSIPRRGSERSEDGLGDILSSYVNKICKRTRYYKIDDATHERKYED